MANDFDKLFGDDWRPGEGSGDNASPDENGSGSSATPSDGFTSEIESSRVERSLNEREVRVMGVFVQEEEGAPPQHFVLLRDNKSRRVPIWVGQFEALAISLTLEGHDPIRPQTHDLTKLLLDKLGATVERIIIDDLWNETFYAKIVIQKPEGGTMDVDARPSDAIALAVRSHAPIYMDEAILEQSGTS